MNDKRIKLIININNKYFNSASLQMFDGVKSEEERECLHDNEAMGWPDETDTTEDSRVRCRTTGGEEEVSMSRACGLREKKAKLSCV